MKVPEMQILILGYGHAGRAYANALSSLNFDFELTIVDLDENLRFHIPSGANFSAYIPQINYELAILATPPATHLQELNKLTKKSKKIIIEKPFATSTRELDKIFALSQENNIFFSIHARYGEEIRLARHALCTSDTHSQISQLFLDPYYPDGPQNLGGPFWDSIFNALGVINELLDEISIENVHIVRSNQSIFEIRCELVSAQGAFSYSLIIDWKQKMNLKVTEVSSGCRKNGILVNHSQQCLTTLSGEHLQHIPFTQSRLSAHYAAVLRDCLQASSFAENNRMAKTITEQVKILSDHKCSANLS